MAYLPEENKYLEELKATAAAIVAPGKGILASDESTGTIGKRFADINVENKRENRRAYRHLLFTTKGLSEHISGAILYEETLYEKTEDGKVSFAQILKDANIIIGIKVDKGTRPLPGTNGELYTQGLTDLDKRCAEYYAAGARFAKWRAVVTIGPNGPSALSIQETAYTLARYASICQANGLVPIVEPEILMDGSHDLKVAQFWTEKVISACYAELMKQHVVLEGTLLKPNMVLPGKECKEEYSVEQKARATLGALRRAVPPAVPGITFLSGGQSEEDATVHLNAINKFDSKLRPWSLTFSYGRALQKSCLAEWLGKSENIAKAQDTLLIRARANGQASLGKYGGDAATAASSQSSYVKNYTY